MMASLKTYSNKWSKNLIAAVAMSVSAFAWFYRNKNDIYSLKRLNLTLFVIPVVFVLLVVLSTHVLFPLWERLTRGERIQLVLISLGFMGLLFWVRPLPLPDIAQYHQMTISATGQKGEAASSSLVEIHGISYLNGSAPGLDSILMTPDWRVSDHVFYSKGASDSKLEIKGYMPAGLQLNLRYFKEAGTVVLTWDGLPQNIDLFRKESTTVATIYKGLNLLTLPFDQALLVVGLSSLYVWGILLTIMGIVYTLRSFLGERFTPIIYLLALAVLALLFLWVKTEYLRVDTGRIFRDSLAYVQISEEPLTSLTFWAGSRSFTLPLFLKWLGVNSQNFNMPGQMEWIAKFQTVFSAFCWGILALVLTRSIRRRWLGILVFGLILFFSLSMEISLWDALLLSESISFSLWVLMLAAWIALLNWMSPDHPGWVKWGLMAGSMLITILYTFVRDSNIYFVLISAVVILLGVLAHPRLLHLRKVFCVYAGFVVVLYLALNTSMNVGNRWQIFIYDDLAMRILKSPESTRFFKDEGLPVSEKLMNTTHMVGFEYQKMIMEDADLKPVRSWVNCCGKNAYMKYLLSSPWKNILEPFNKYSKLLNANNIEYRSPRYDVQPLPDEIASINAFFFNHQPWMLISAGLMILIGVCVYLFKTESPLWLVVFALALSVYPMMFLVWHGEPLEIERHAVQIGVQFRLAGWLALVLLAGKIRDLTRSHLKI